jgi:hypothetical protein
MIVEALGTNFTFPTGTEVLHVDYRTGSLAITVKECFEARTVRVAFRDVVGLRVLDEGNMLAFWPACSRPNGWLFRVYEGGWLEQEARRPDFLLGDIKSIREYLVTGIDDCVNVLAFQDPEISVHPLAPPLFRGEREKAE